MTAGSDNTLRPFFRIDSGELASGTRMSLSYAYQDADKWKGKGIQRQHQANFKIVQPIGAATLTGSSTIPTGARTTTRTCRSR